MPTPAAPFSLLTSLIASPVCMRAPEHHALVRSLWQRHNGAAAPERVATAVPAVSAAAPGTAQPLPWEVPLYTVENGIAFLAIDGPMIKGYDDFTAWYFRCASIDRLQRELLQIADLGRRGQVRALVNLYNSPGGSAMGTPELGAQIGALDDELPVFGYTSDLACSAAYWALASSRLVFATPSSMIGSIGTYLAMYDWRGYLEELGIKLELFRAGNLKGIGVPGKEFTDDERAFLTSRVQRINSRFTGHVRAFRGDIAESTMQGQWFDGEEGVSLGLVDATVSGLPELVAAVQEEL